MIQDFLLNFRNKKLITIQYTLKCFQGMATKLTVNYEYYVQKGSIYILYIKVHVNAHNY